MWCLRQRNPLTPVKVMPLFLKVLSQPFGNAFHFVG
jgi:hypothetical protein